MAKLTAERDALLAEISRDPSAVRHDAYARIGEIESDTAAAESQWLDLSAKVEALKD